MKNNQSIDDAINEAKRIEEQWLAAGFDQVARLVFANGVFEDNKEDGKAVVKGGLQTTDLAILEKLVGVESSDTTPGVNVLHKC